jgi:TM2 domain-containing membrane protein YozV
MTAAGPQAYKSKTFATWLAVIAGSLGLHRFYLHGFRDRWGWLFIWPTLIGLYGVQRMRQLGGDDHLAWALIPLLGLMVAIGMFSAILYGLTPDERWNTRFNPTGPQHRMGWATIIGVVLALVIGGGVLMATLAFSAQRYFEYEAEAQTAQTNSARPIQ